MYCGTDELGRLVASVRLLSDWGSIQFRTYTEPPIGALRVSHGTLTPILSATKSRYDVPDVANAETRITITAPPMAGYAVAFYEGGNGHSLWGSAVGGVDRLTGILSCSRGYVDHLGSLIKLTDADPNTSGFQVDLYDGENYVHIRGHSTTNCGPGSGYTLYITRAEGSISIPRPNRPVIGKPSIGPTYVGRPFVGLVLTADTNSVRDRDGWDPATFSYQWLADDVEIASATSSSYTVTDAVLGKTLKVRVSFTDDRGTEESATSTETERVSTVPNPNNRATGSPIINGTPRVGETLTADTSGIADADGMSSSTLSYKWRANRGNNSYLEITGATDSSYLLAASDEGAYIGVQVFFTDDSGNREALSSNRTEAVEARLNSLATGTPAITGTAQVGETLTADTAGISDADGLANVSYSYQWISNDGTSDTDIAGATDSTYILVADDEGKTIKVRVSFTDDAGSDETLTSTATVAVAAQSSPNAGAPTIKGTAKVGETLTVDTTGMAQGLVRAIFSYQWVSNDGSADTDIPNATDSAYILVAPDEGKTMKVRVSFTNNSGNEETMTSAATVAVAAQANSEATGAPTISGTAQAGETLTADTSGIADADGLANVSYSYQWVANDETSDTDISGAMASTYTLTANEEGQTIKVRVSFTDDAGHGETLISAATVAVAAAEPQEPPAKPWNLEAVVNDDGTVTLTWDDPGDDSITGYQILRRNRDSSATGVFEVHVEDTGSAATSYVDHDVTPETRYNYRVKARNESGLSRRSNFVKADTPAPNSPATDAPAIGGTAQVGETLTADTSGIADSDGLGNATFSYQWVADDTDISDATGSTYTLKNADEGKTIKVRVSFTDDAGNEETLTSAATAQVVAKPNTPATGAPSISGTAQVDETLTASVSDIADTDGLNNATFSYQWIGNEGNTDADIQGATNATYTLVSEDQAKTVKVRVSFTDDRGSEETLTSAATAEVAAKPNSPATGLPTISGTVQVDETLTADTTGIADADGLDDATFTYQWLADDTDISGATASTYVPVSTDEGKAVRVRVSFTDDQGNEESLTSAATDAVAAAEPTEPPPKPTNLTAVVNDDGSVTLSWDAPDDDSVTGYQVLRRRPSEEEKEPLVYVEDTGSTATTYTDTNVTAGIRHVYRVKAINAAGLGQRSNYVRVEP